MELAQLGHCVGGRAKLVGAVHTKVDGLVVARNVHAAETGKDETRVRVDKAVGAAVWQDRRGGLRMRHGAQVPVVGRRGLRVVRGGTMSTIAAAFEGGVVENPSGGVHGVVREVVGEGSDSDHHKTACPTERPKYERASSCP